MKLDHLLRPQPLAAYARIRIEDELVYHTVQSGAFEAEIKRRRAGRYSLKLDKRHGKSIRDLLQWGLAHVFVIPTHRTIAVMVERIDLKLPRIEIRMKGLAGPHRQSLRSPHRPPGRSPRTMKPHECYACLGSCEGEESVFMLLDLAGRVRIHVRCYILFLRGKAAFLGRQSRAKP